MNRHTSYARSHPERWNERTKRIHGIKPGESAEFPASEYCVVRTTCSRFNDTHYGKAKWACRKTKGSETCTVTRIY